MAKLLCVLCILVTLFALSNSAKEDANPPMLASDCEFIIYEMIDCIPYLQVHESNQSKPNDPCCVGFQSVREVSDYCICVAIQEIAQLDITLNLTKASTLSQDCGFTASSIIQCDITAPAASPKNAPVSPVHPLPPKGTSQASPPATQVPSEGLAPAPAHNAAHSIAVSFAVLIFSTIVVYGCNASN